MYPLISIHLAEEKIDFQRVAPYLYAADLLGAFAGTFIFSLFFIPFLGIALSLDVLLMILLLGGLWSLFF